MFGGARCTCEKCEANREKRQRIKTIQRQMHNAGIELDALAAMMDRWPEKQKELRVASDMLAEWEIGIEKEMLE